VKARVALVLAALCVAFAPLPADVVERWYSNGFYARLQSIVTPLTNLVPLALLDIAVLVLVAAGAWRLFTRWRRHGVRSACGRAAVDLVSSAALLYIVFVLMWGLNYRRVPLERKLDFDQSRVTRAAALRLANDAAGLVNRGHAAGHAGPIDVTSLERAFGEVQRALGSMRSARAGAPKRSLLGWYFRAAAIDGMTDPFFLEIIVNPDLLDVERPFVLAHEWAHLAGFASESEANFVAWLTCIGGDPQASYSGWLAAYQHAAQALPRDERRTLTALEPGPRDDLRAIAARNQRSSETVRTAARDVYDSYLRANRVPEGIESYGAVLRLMLGSRFDEGWRPRLSSR
jgi:hypothetical protein